MSDIDAALDGIGGDAYLCAVGEITPHEAMVSIQAAVKSLRSSLLRELITEPTELPKPQVPNPAHWGGSADHSFDPDCYVCAPQTPDPDPAPRSPD